MVDNKKSTCQTLLTVHICNSYDCTHLHRSDVLSGGRAAAAGFRLPATPQPVVHAQRSLLCGGRALQHPIEAQQNLATPQVLLAGCCSCSQQQSHHFCFSMRGDIG